MGYNNTREGFGTSDPFVFQVGAALPVATDRIAPSTNQEGGENIGALQATGQTPEQIGKRAEVRRFLQTTTLPAPPVRQPGTGQTIDEEIRRAKRATAAPALLAIAAAILWGL